MKSICFALLFIYCYFNPVKGDTLKTVLKTDSSELELAETPLSQNLNTQYPNFYFQGLGSIKDNDETGISSVVSENFDGNKQLDYGFILYDYFEKEDSGFCMKSSYAILEEQKAGFKLQKTEVLANRCEESREKLADKSFNIELIPKGKIQVKVERANANLTKKISLNHKAFKIRDKALGREVLIYFDKHKWRRVNLP